MVLIEFLRHHGLYAPGDRVRRTTVEADRLTRAGRARVVPSDSPPERKPKPAPVDRSMQAPAQKTPKPRRRRRK